MARQILLAAIKYDLNPRQALARCSKALLIPQVCPLYLADGVPRSSVRSTVQASVLFYLFGRVWSCNLQIVTSKMREFSQERFTGPQGAWIRHANLLISSNTVFNTKGSLFDTVQVAELLSSHDKS